MSNPDWLRAGHTLADQDDERWRILSVHGDRVELGHPDRGKHEVLTNDLIQWVETGQWTPETSG